MPKYNPADIEKKWQKYWDDHHTFSATEDTTKKKFYALIEFPYPSGAGLHVGHSRPFTAMDVIARKHRMQGENVLYPIGFDAFGLPTENFAIKTGRPPADVTAENIANFTRQLKASGFSFDWSRVIDTTDPAYFKWTQWLFLQFYKHGLAYKKNQPINWCPKDKIGLANEEVVNGCCERCGTTVEKRNKEQWMLAITKYADKLLKGLESVDYIPQAKTQQQNWIGKSEGAKIIFCVIASGATVSRSLGKQSPQSTSGSVSKINSESNEIATSSRSDGTPRNDTWQIEVFTTRPDTIYGVTFIAVSPELAKRWIDVGWTANDAVKKYITDTLTERSVAAATRDEQEKTGIDAGITAINPLSGEAVPVWITNYVLGDVGTGAIMGVPAHDDRDFAFAKKYQLPTKEVVEPLFKKTDGPDAVRPTEPFKKRRNAVAIVKHWNEDKYLCFKWKKTDWRGFVIGGIEEGEDAVATAQREIAEETGYTSAQFVRSLGGTVHAQYYQLNKQENRWAHFEGFLFQLKNGDKKEVAQEEKDIQDAHWISKNDVENFLSWVEDMKLLWHRVLTDDAFGGEGIVVNSGEFNGLLTVDARAKIIARLEELGVGNYETQFKLRDWVFSRQRYWGEPIPLVYCEACATNVKNCHPERSRAEPKDPLTFGSSDSLLGVSATSAIARNDTYSMGEIMNPGWIPLPDSSLPLELPKVEKYEPTDTGESPLAAMEDWVTTTCPRCGGQAQRETDTMPNWAGSSWYFLRYCDPHNDKQFASKENLAYWMGADEQAEPASDPKKLLRYCATALPAGGVDWYNGGMEHTVLHLLYSRFWNQFLFDIGLVPTSEPYKKRTSHGLILAKGGEKMSKSKGNVVSPDDVIKEYGADTLRTYIMFMGPFDQPVEWDMNGLVGVRRFLERTWNLQDKIQSTADGQQSTATDPKQLTVTTKLHQTIKKITEDIEAMRFNTAVAKLMELINVFSEAESLPREYVGIFARLLSPFAPHLCEELWHVLGNTDSISTAAWPTYDPNSIADTELTIAIQINGKVRDTITVPVDATEETLKAQALSTEKIKGWLEGKEPKKVIYVKGKLLSLVL